MPAPTAAHERRAGGRPTAASLKLAECRTEAGYIRVRNGVEAGQDHPMGQAIALLAARGDQGIAVFLVASIVVPLAILTGVCWFFWKHRHDE
jgi:hypothetical protein